MENDERARVARALREIETPTWPTLTEAVMGHVATREKVVERLADLMEPPRQCPHYHSDRHYCSVHEDMAAVDCDASATHTDTSATCDMSQSRCDTFSCDRDALLALAEDVDGAADDSGGFEPLAGMLRDIASRIREALGVG